MRILSKSKGIIKTARESLSRLAWWFWGALVGYIALSNAGASPEVFAGAVLGAVLFGWIILYILDNALEWAVRALSRTYNKVTE